MPPSSLRFHFKGVVYGGDRCGAFEAFRLQGPHPERRSRRGAFAGVGSLVRISDSQRAGCPAGAAFQLPASQHRRRAVSGKGRSSIPDFWREQPRGWQQHWVAHCRPFAHCPDRELQHESEGRARLRAVLLGLRAGHRRVLAGRFGKSPRRRRAMRVLTEGELNKNFPFWIGQRIRCLNLDCGVLFILQEGDTVAETRGCTPIYGHWPSIIGYTHYYRIRCPGKKSGWSDCDKMLNFQVKVFDQLVLACPVGASRKKLEDQINIQ